MEAEKDLRGVAVVAAHREGESEAVSERVAVPEPLKFEEIVTLREVDRVSVALLVRLLEPHRV